MGLAERLKAIEGNQNVSSNSIYQHNNYLPDHQTLQYSHSVVPSVTPSAPPLPTQNTQPQYQYEQHQSSPIQYNQGSTNQYNQPSYQQVTQPLNPAQGTGLLSQLSTKLTQKFWGQQFPNTNTQGPYYNAIKQRIDSVIQDKNLHHFYPFNSPQYNTLLNRVSHVDFPTIAQKRKIPLELAFDLSALALVDVVIFIDDSGSMNFDEQWNPSTEKTDDLKLILSRIVDIASMFDDDGMNMRFFNSDMYFDNVSSEQQANSALLQIHYNGGTPIGKNLVTKVLEPFVYAKARNNQLTKPVMIYIITDGVPDNKNELKDNIRICKEWLKQTPYGKSAVNIMFAQVGNSQSASHYLKTELDNDVEIGEDVDTTGNFELEYHKYQKKGVELTPDLWLLQMTLGSIVRAYDEGNN